MFLSSIARVQTNTRDKIVFRRVFAVNTYSYCPCACTDVTPDYSSGSLLVLVCCGNTLRDTICLLWRVFGETDVLATTAACVDGIL